MKSRAKSKSKVTKAKVVKSKTTKKIAKQAHKKFKVLVRGSNLLVINETGDICRAGCYVIHLLEAPTADHAKNRALALTKVDERLWESLLNTGKDQPLFNVEKIKEIASFKEAGMKPPGSDIMYFPETETKAKGRKKSAK